MYLQELALDFASGLFALPKNDRTFATTQALFVRGR